MRLCGIVVGLAIGAVLAGCGSSTVAESAPAGTGPATSTAATTTTTSERFDGGRNTLTGEARGDATALLERIDVGAHDGYDRVVFRFRGDSLPGYHIGFVQRPLHEDGSGDNVPLDGGAILGVRLEPASGFDLSGEGSMVYQGPKRIAGAQYGTRVVTELARTGDFEAVLGWAIGLDHATDFRVLRLDGPPRLVVDVES